MNFRHGDIITRKSQDGQTIWLSQRFVMEVAEISEEFMRTTARKRFKQSVLKCYHHHNILPDTGKAWRWAKMPEGFYYDLSRIPNRTPQNYRELCEVGIADASDKTSLVTYCYSDGYIRYGSKLDGGNYDGINVRKSDKIVTIGTSAQNNEDKVQLAGNISTEATNVLGNKIQLVHNPLYTEDPNIRESRNAQNYLYVRSNVVLPENPIFGQRFEIANWGSSSIDITHPNTGVLFNLPPNHKITGIAGNKGFVFDRFPVEMLSFDI